MDDWPPDWAGEPGAEVRIDTSVAHQARVYDYWLGGKDNYAVDREVAEQALAAYPGLRRSVRSLSGPCATSLARPGYASSSISVPASRPRTTPTRSLRRRRRMPGSCTSTMTRLCWCMPAPC